MIPEFHMAWDKILNVWALLIYSHVLNGEFLGFFPYESHGIDAQQSSFPWILQVESFHICMQNFPPQSFSEAGSEFRPEQQFTA